ncbi:ExeM/NucH family extracellular endonuclease [Alteromonas sp. A081]|uniref:ExeM/NucH family extracellular endonuclease n=1 Tax=Alteromonas sp. A081 TaxID=3410269 RepID=UPI003B9835C5
MVKQGGSKKPTLMKSAIMINALLGSALSLNVMADTIWQENFEASALQNKGAVGQSDAPITVNMDGVTRWTIDVSAAELTATSDWFKVTANALQARDVDGEVVWQSEAIDISGQENVSLDVLLSQNGVFEDNDYIDVFYSVDGQSFELVTLTNGDTNTVKDDFGTATVTASIPQGSSLVIRVAMANNAGSEYLNLDSVTVTSTNSEGAGSGDSSEGTPSTGLRLLSETCFNCPDLQAINLADDFVDSIYYASLNTALSNQESPESLKATTQDIISNGHRTLSYSEAWTALTYTDEDPANTDNVILFYKGTSQSKFTNGSGSQSTNQDNWNREHVWASSHGFSSSSLTAYSDILHLRPSDISVNSSRGNLDFDFSDQPLSEAPENRIDSDSFEPRNAVKGDVARALMYMDVRYDGSNSTDAEADLVLLDRLTTTDEAALGKLCVLLQWHESDPVDEFERTRNNRVFEFQGNRNPFIDKPELASLIFNESCDGSGGSDGNTGGDTGGGNGSETGGGSGNDAGGISTNSVYISEYIEGGGFNKGIELFNSSSASVDLTGYALRLFSNGDTADSDGKELPLEGVLASGDVATYVHNSADPSMVGESTISSSFVINFNGDDYIELTYQGNVIDAVGTFGVRTNWGKDTTLVRKSSVTAGNPNRNANFDPSVEWDVFAKDTLEYFGAHNGNISEPSEPTDPVDPTDPTDPVEPTDPTTEVTLISAIQGDGDTSPLVGSTVLVEAVVTKVVPEMSGFFVQEEASDSDGNDATSEGVFVYSTTFTDMPPVGDMVRLRADVVEFNGLTELVLTQAPEVIGAGESIKYTTLAMPFAAGVDLESFEGMQISFEQTLKVTDNFNLGRFGQFNVASERLMIPTNQFVAGSQEAINLAEQNARNSLIVDDGANSQNRDDIPFPVGGLSHANPLRLGDSVENLEGVVHYGFGSYYLIPVSDIQTVRTSPRLRSPVLNAVGDVKVASFNVLNYFNGPDFPTARGADSEAEFVRQQAKTVSAILSMDADLLGLVEIENDGDSSESAIASLVASINAELGNDAYSYIASGSQLGGDAIAVGIIYKPSVVTPSGSPVTSSEAPFDFGNRQPLLQSFTVNGNGEDFTLAVNHFKSKGSCGSATGGNADSGDGQGCWNALRTDAAQALLSLIEQNSDVLSPRVLVMGDLNAYAKEEPILAIESAGYSNLVNQFDGDSAYSYSFGGEIGYLDHALSSASLTEFVVDATVWHINADEPRVFDYNVEFKTDMQLSTYYAPDAYRSSDHDPVVVVLNFPEEVTVGDLDGDNDVDYNDIMAFYQAFLSGQPLDSSFDFNNDGNVNFFDLQALMAMCTRAGCAI